MTAFRINIRRTKQSTVLLGLMVISFISFAILIFMLDITSHLVEPDRRNYNKKSYISLFSAGNTSQTRGRLGQLAFYEKGAKEIKSAFTTSTCGRPNIIQNGSQAKANADLSFVTLDELAWQTFGANHVKAVAKMARLGSGMVQEFNSTAISLERNQTIDEIFYDFGLLLGIDRHILLPGGHWKPRHCKPKWKVAIVIPFRDRVAHLAIFLRHMIPFLRRQSVEFSVFVVEQTNNRSFNRAMLLNVGFKEALKLTRYDCFIFHDVDHLPINNNNYYGCENMPRHFISGDDIWGYTLAYQDLFGGVTGLTRNQMIKVNGFSNVYWGWGGEDDDIYKRIQVKGYTRSRPEGSIGFYDTLRHGHRKKEENFQRFCLLHFSGQRLEVDGLTDIQYDPPRVELTPLFTKISVDIKELPWRDEWVKCGPLKDLFDPEGFIRGDVNENDKDRRGDESDDDFYAIPGKRDANKRRRHRPPQLKDGLPPVRLNDPPNMPPKAPGKQEVEYALETKEIKTHELHV